MAAAIAAQLGAVALAAAAAAVAAAAAAEEGTSVAAAAGGGQPSVHMVTFTTDMYHDRFAASLRAKEAYARHWGYTWEVFDESSLDCSGFRPHRWRGDFRYCKLQALKVIWQRVRKKRERSQGQRNYIFWHDVDTHIMRPETPLHAFLEAAGDAAVVFTDNPLSLNNGVFFLQVSNAGSAFLKRWRKGCRSGEWPWADNGCMYEVLLSYFGKERYEGRCRQYRVEEYDQSRPEPPTGTQLMRCFNDEMRSLGMDCCGAARGIDSFAFLTGVQDSFNHHPCHELEKNKDFTDEERAKIPAHCFSEGMFMVHTKDIAYAETSEKRVRKMIADSKVDL